MIGDNCGNDTDGRHTGHEECEYEAAHGTKRALGIVRQALPGEQDVRPVGVPGHDPRPNVGQPGTGGDEADHQEEKANEVCVDHALAIEMHNPGQQCQPDEPDHKWNQADCLWSRRSDPSTHPERRTQYPPQGQTGGQHGGQGDADGDDQHVCDREREVARSEWRPGDRDVLKCRPKSDEENEPEDNAGKCGHDCFDCRNCRDLPRCGTYQSHGGHPLLTACRCQSGRGGEEDENGKEQCQRPNNEDDQELL